MKCQTTTKCHGRWMTFENSITSLANWMIQDNTSLKSFQPKEEGEKHGVSSLQWGNYFVHNSK